MILGVGWVVHLDSWVVLLATLGFSWVGRPRCCWVVTVGLGVIFGLVLGVGVGGGWFSWVSNFFKNFKIRLLGWC